MVSILLENDTWQHNFSRVKRRLREMRLYLFSNLTLTLCVLCVCACVWLCVTNHKIDALIINFIIIIHFSKHTQFYQTKSIVVQRKTLNITLLYIFFVKTTKHSSKNMNIFPTNARWKTDNSNTEILDILWFPKLLCHRSKLAQTLERRSEQYSLLFI